MKYVRNVAEGAGYDLIVCGGGPSGCAAALSARREGLKVLLLEGRAQLGGMATSGHISHWLGGRTEGGDWVVGGIFRALAEEATERGCAKIPHPIPGCTYQPHGWLPWFIHGIPVDPFATATLLDEKLQSAGVDVLLETQVMDAIVGDERISHVVVANKSGIQAVPCVAVCDATGDADVAAFSGCEVQIGREEDGLMTPASLGFHLSNVDSKELAAYIETHKSPKFREKIQELRATGIWNFPYEIFITIQLLHEDEVMVNTMRLPGMNGIDGSSRTDGLMQGRREAYQLLDIFRRHFPGFKNAPMKSIASMLGIRETRRIIGDYCLRVQDLSSEVETEDTVGFSIYGWDLPDPLRPSHQPLVNESTGKYINKVEKGLSTPIPYRIMVPRPIRNLLCPGRAVSVERDVLGPLRVMAPCMAMGEAFGVAAGQMVKSRVSANEVDISDLRNRLRAVGCIVDHDKLPPIAPRMDP